MISFNMAKSNPYYSGADMATDAGSYGAGATSIDYSIWAVGENHSQIHYKMALEWWNGSYWEARELQTGYFISTTPTKMIYLAGKPAGSYRFTCYINVGCSNCGTTYINRTDAFVVKR
jgi:surface antigen